MKNNNLCYVKTSYGYTDIKPGDDCTRYERELTKSMCELACTKMYVNINYKFVSYYASNMMIKQL